jgi:hypothetical protein
LYVILTIMRIKFIRTFSYREVLSAFLASLILISLILVYSFLNFQKTTLSGIFFLIASFVISLIINHRIYFLEHSRRNNLIGRIFQNILLSFFMITSIYSFLFLLNMTYFVGHFSNLIFVVLFFVFISEIITSIFNSILIRYKWQIW